MLAVGGPGTRFRDENRWSEGSSGCLTRWVSCRSTPSLRSSFYSLPRPPFRGAETSPRRFRGLSSPLSLSPLSGWILQVLSGDTSVAGWTLAARPAPSLRSASVPSPAWGPSRPETLGCLFPQCLVCVQGVFFCFGRLVRVIFHFGVSVLHRLMEVQQLIVLHFLGSLA